MLTRGLILTRSPTVAPNTLNSRHFQLDGQGSGERKNKHFARYQIISNHFGLPRSRPLDESKAARFVFVIASPGKLDPFVPRSTPTCIPAQPTVDRLLRVSDARSHRRTRRR